MGDVIWSDKPYSFTLALKLMHLPLCSAASRRGRPASSTGQSKQRGTRLRPTRPTMKTTTTWDSATPRRDQMQRSLPRRVRPAHCGSTATSRRTYERSLASRVTRAALASSTSGCHDGVATSGRNPFVSLTLHGFFRGWKNPFLRKVQLGGPTGFIGFLR